MSLIKSLTGHSDIVRSVSFSRDGESIVSGSDDNTVKVWSTEPLPVLPYDLGEDITHVEFNVERPVAIRHIYDDVEQDNSEISCHFMGGAKVFPVRCLV